MLGTRLHHVFSYLALAFLVTLSPTANAALSDKDLAALQLLVLGPKSNGFQQCLDSSFDLLGGLLAVGHAPDEKVLALLTQGEMNATQRERRDQQATMWKEHHSPAKLAHFQFTSCLAERQLPPVDLGERGEQCFNIVMIPTYAALLKTGMKVGKEEALQKINQTWSAQAKPDFLQRVVSDVYAADGLEKTRAISRKVFIACLSAN